MLFPEGNQRRGAYEIVPTPHQALLYGPAPMRGPGGKSLDSYRGVQRQVSKVHPEIPHAVHVVGEAVTKDLTGWPIQWDPG